MRSIYKFHISFVFILFNFMILFLSIKYVTYEGYTFKISKDGNCLAVVAGKSNIGQMIQFKEDSLYLDEEQIQFRIKKEAEKNYDIDFLLSDGIEFGAKGFNTSWLWFQSKIGKPSFAGTIDNSMTERENKKTLLISATMSYIGIKNFRFMISVYIGVEVFLVMLGFVLFMRPQVVLDQLNKIKRVHFESDYFIKFFGLAIPVVGALSVHLFLM